MTYMLNGRQYVAIASGSNILTFALWYWEVDGGGPLRRLLRGSPPSTDFAFPPQ